MEASRQRTGIARLLSLFTPVESAEVRTVLLLTFGVFLILASYYLIKPVREALILAAPGGAEWKSYAAAGQALLLLGAVPIYSALASRWSRRRLIRGVMWFFIVNLAAFYLIVRVVGGGTLMLGLAFFLWVGIFNLMVPAQFWSFANDLYTPDQGKRLFVLLAFGASMGAVVGSDLSTHLIGPLGLDQMLLVAAGLLLAAMVIMLAVERRACLAADRKLADQPLGRGDAFAMVLRRPYLLRIALLLLVTNWVNTTGEYILSRTVRADVERSVIAEQVDEARRDQLVGERVGQFYAGFYRGVNLLGVLLQLFVVSRVLRWFGVRVALFVLPIIALGGYAAIAFGAAGMLALVRWVKTAENATDYSLQNTVRQALFLPTEREEKYKAKQAIDTFFIRAGDVLSAVLVYVGTTWLALRTNEFAMVALCLVLVWLLLAGSLGRDFQRLHRAREVQTT